VVESPAPVATGRGGDSGAGAHGGRRPPPGGQWRRPHAPWRHRCAVGVPASATAATTGATAVPPELSRKRKRGFSNLRYVALCPCAPDFEWLWCSVLYFFVRRVTPTVPALAPAKVLKSDTSVLMRRHSSRAPQEVGSAAATGEPPRGTAVATGPQ
jgi:hypothetical protein